MIATSADGMTVSELYRDTGVVLRTYKLGESDRIVVLLTAENGKVRAVAKGVRKTKSKFGARLEPMSHVRLLLYRGRELDIVSQAESVEPLSPMLSSASTGRRRGWPCSRPSTSWRSSASRTRSSTGCWSACCARSPSARRRSSCRRSTGSCSPPRACGPQLDACVRCGEAEPDVALVAFDLDEGGVLCRTCRSGHGDQRRRRWRCCATSSAAGSTRRSPREESPATHEVSSLATKALEHHIERRLEPSPCSNPLTTPVCDDRSRPSSESRRNVMRRRIVGRRWSAVA